MLKDYYKILEVKPQASLQEIRKSFRRLAMRYHPDKHPEDKVALAHFREIQEAYEILNDPVRREQYHQERWYARSMGRKMKGSAPPTTGTILQELLALEKHLAGQDPFRTNQLSAYHSLETLLSEDALDILREENDPDLLPEILRLSLSCGKHLPYPLAQALTEKLGGLYSLPDSQEAAQIRHYLALRKRAAWWERWRVPLLLLATIALCILIFRAA